LAISKQLTELMGGKMIQRQLQSLSVASELAPNASEAISKMKKAHVEKTPFQVAIFDTALSDNRNGRFLLLLVEDNVINQKVALGMLKKMGYRADIASDGYQAIKILETSCYDLIFMDCHMAHMDGYEATQIIRDANSNVIDHHVPIIAMTANAMTGDRQKCLDAGMSDYMSKPIRPEILSGVLKKWLAPKTAPSIGNP